MTLPIVLTHTPEVASPVGRMDFNVASGELDVTWRLTAQTHRYLTSYVHFCGLMGEDTAHLSSALGRLKSSRLGGAVEQADLLATRYPARLDITAETAPAREEELKARWFRAQMTQGPAASQWVETALFA